MTARIKLVGALVVVLVACGDGDGGRAGEDSDAGAGGADAGPDADLGGADAAPTTGRCAVVRPGPAMAVIFHDGAGEPLGVVTTGADGMAAFDGCVPGGMVTLVNPAPLAVVASRKLVTVQGVGPGDVVNVDPVADAPAHGPMSMTVQNGLDEVTAGAVGYVVSFGVCTSPALALPGATGGAVQVADMTDCLGDDRGDLVGVSIARGELGTPIGFARSHSTDVVSPSVASGGTWVKWTGPTQVKIVNVPAGAEGGFRTVIPLIDGVSYGIHYGSAPLTDGVVDLAYWPDEIVDEHRVALTYSWKTESVFTTALIHTSSPPTTIDASDLLLARPRTMVVHVSEPTRPRITWLEGDDRADQTRAELRFQDDAGSGTWIILAPGNPRELRVPVLDAAHAAVGPHDGSQIGLNQLFLIDRESSHAALFGERVMTAGALDTYSVGVDEIPGKTLRYVGYEIAP